MINKTSTLPSAEVIERLKGVDFIGEDDSISKTIHKSFQHRKNEGIALSLQNLSLPERENVNGREVYRTKDFYIGKKIFEVFPEESIPQTSEIVRNGGCHDAGERHSRFRKPGGAGNYGLAGQCVGRQDVLRSGRSRGRGTSHAHLRCGL